MSTDTTVNTVRGIEIALHLKAENPGRADVEGIRRFVAARSFCLPAAA
jgi:hypothetical protein